MRISLSASESGSRLLAALDLEGDQRRAAAHLLLHDAGLRMIGAAGINQPRDFRVLGERVGKRAGVFGLPAHPHRQRLQALEQTQALNGDSDGPVCRSSTWIFCQMNFCEPRMMPPRQRPWPSICLVAE